MQDFKTWSFRLKGDGSLNSSTEVFMKDIMPESNVYSIKDCDEPIIKREGITKLIDHFGFVEEKIEPLYFPQNNGVYLVLIHMRDPHNNVIFFGDGEASDKNLQKGIAANYPIAMAIKRARSRAVLNYLGIEAYGADESPDFKEITQEDIGKLTPERIADIEKIYGESITKRKLKNYLSEILSMMNPKMSKEEVQLFLSKALGTDPKEKVILADLSLDQILNVISAFKVSINMDPDTANQFMTKLSNETI